jgi:hypothetical protein
MFLKNKLLLVFFAWALLSSNNALSKAHDHGQLQKHQDTIVSPFDSKKEVRSLHCLMRTHTHQGICPHSKSESNQTVYIANDCGGKKTPTIPNTTSFSNDFGKMSFLTLTHYSSDKMLTPSHMLSYYCFIDSLDPPPRAI